MKIHLRQFSLQGSMTFMLSKIMLFTALATALSGALLPCSAIAATASQQQSPMLIATAYTDLTLPTLRRGDRGRSVAQLQQILSDDGFLHAAGVRLGNPGGAVVDGVFGAITESAVKDLQQRYNIPVTGQVNPRTWEAIDRFENSYRSPLPWKS